MDVLASSSPLVAEQGKRVQRTGALAKFADESCHPSQGDSDRRSESLCYPSSTCLPAWTDAGRLSLCLPAQSLLETYFPSGASNWILFLK